MPYAYMSYTLSYHTPPPPLSQALPRSYLSNALAGALSPTLTNPFPKPSSHASLSCCPSFCLNTKQEALTYARTGTHSHTRMQTSTHFLKHSPTHISTNLNTHRDLCVTHLHKSQHTHLCDTSPQISTHTETHKCNTQNKIHNTQNTKHQTHAPHTGAA